MKRSWALVALLACAAFAQSLPNHPGSFRFAVIGDSGTGQQPQYQVGARLASYYEILHFETVLMLGDNMYGSDSPKDYARKFELPYQPMLKAGVKFHASLGNHDSPRQAAYPLFNMGGKRYYTFRPHRGIRFFALDSTLMDKGQLEWLRKELEDSGSDWKIAFFHHPLYSSAARHGSDLGLRKVLEPLFVKYGVSLVLSGHDHVYERMKPQQGIHYFVIGNSAKLRAGSVLRSPLTEKSFDRDRGFAVMEIDGDTMYFQVVSRTGATVDSGSFQRPGAL